MDRIKYVINLLIVLIIFMAISIQRDQKLFGREVSSLLNPSEPEVYVEPEKVLPDGSRTLNSTSIAKDVVGFGGRTPVKLSVKDDVILNVEVLPNSETPSFLEQVIKDGLIESWNGMHLTNAAVAVVDSVSGATYTSKAISENVKRAAAFGSNMEAESASFWSSIGLRDIFGVCVVISGVVLTLIKKRQKWVMAIQQALNVVVLGFWCGSFLSLSTVVSWISNGVNLSLSLIAVSLAVVVLIMPLFNKKGSYCYMHCPMGSAQDLLGKIPVKRLAINPKLNGFLNNLRYYILNALLLMMWLGVGFNLINYEVFSAFIVRSASNVVMIMAVIFWALSIFVPRPYCRFVCPFGALLTMSQKTNH